MEETNESFERQLESRLDLSPIRDSVRRVRTEISKIIVGQDEMLEQLVVALLADGHVLLEGVPGVAKTLTTKLLARTLAVDYARIQFTPDLMPSDVLGTSVFNLSESRFEFKPGPIFSNFVLIDEINRAPAKTQAALFEVMEERQVTIDGKTYPMGAPFLVMATQNPIEQEGTYRLPEAQLDRFLFKVEVPYPSMQEEAMILRGHHERRQQAPVGEVDAVLTAEELQRARAQVQAVHVEDKLMEYIAGIVDLSRRYPDLYLGASPRASIALLNSGKAFAATQGRDFLTPEDVKRMAAPVLRHRLMLTPEREMEGTSINTVISQLVDKVEVPR
ncbi:MoxR-like ATPase [Catalinimonas alkaloidigena]|uniref:MoxR-like ATPase n=1 Tax=Catalinimonas alkaloidigena TaxID=1075417 RepID=A0A1G9INC6_9BACT|nr:MoxR family ATPase [Catalinimonas alkaloidigena]SDL26605.1 MoxR-like ATPase [Catalinimonas alkaloidigena]